MAQPQEPNYQRLADAFIAVGEECSRLPNIPAINNSQTVLDSISQLRNEMRQSATTMGTAITTIQADITTIRADITTIRADITAINTRFDVSEANAIARLFNSTITNSQTLFQPLRSRHNMPVQSFPQNGEALSNLSRTELTTILREYNLSNDGITVDKRKRLAQYIGVMVDVF